MSIIRSITIACVVLICGAVSFHAEADGPIGGAISVIPVFRTVVSGTTDTATVLDATIAWDSSSSSPKTETLYACGSGQKGFTLFIKDEFGYASTAAIVVSPVGGNTIDTFASYPAIFNLGRVSVQCNGAGNWIVK